jgi:hypothetical protein
MENAQRCRVNALLCRQQASLHPEQHWKWLAQAERWEHMAESRPAPKAETSRPTTRDTTRQEPGSAAA